MRKQNIGKQKNQSIGKQKMGNKSHRKHNLGKQIKSLPTPDLNQILTPTLLGQAIRARRTQSGLRLEDAAALCAVAKQTLQDIEHGQETSQFNTILQILSGLGIKLCILPWDIKNEVNDDWQ